MKKQYWVKTEGPPKQVLIDILYPNEKEELDQILHKVHIGEMEEPMCLVATSWLQLAMEEMIQLQRVKDISDKDILEILLEIKPCDPEDRLSGISVMHACNKIKTLIDGLAR